LQTLVNKIGLSPSSISVFALFELDDLGFGEFRKYERLWIYKSWCFSEY